MALTEQQKKKRAELVAAVEKSLKVEKVRRVSVEKAERAAKPYLAKLADAQQDLTRRRKITERRQRRVADFDKRHRKGPQSAIAWARAQVGTVEQPASSNRGPKITPWQQSWGSWLVGQPWCGVFVGVALRDHGGVVGLNSRLAAVAFIEDDAIARRFGWAGWHGARNGTPGDAVILFGRGVHVELIATVHPWGYTTVGGNTSAEGSSGSQSNGGGVFVRSRPFSVVRGCARPRYA